MHQMTRTAGHAMTMRERMLAVLQGREHDRVPFAMYEIMLPAQEAFDLLGHGNIGLIRFCSICRAETPNCRRESQIFFEDGTKWERNILHTPVGDLTELRIFEPAFDSSTARKHFVETREDYERLWSYLGDAVILDNYDQYYRDCAELGDDGIPKTEIERTPWQQLWIEWVGTGAALVSPGRLARACRAHPGTARAPRPADLRDRCPLARAVHRHGGQHHGLRDRPGAISQILRSLV